MKITYIILIIIVLSLHCYGEESSDGKKISSSYSYSFEYDDSEHGNFGHKIEVKDGNSKVNVRSENAKKFNSAVATKPGNPYLPEKNTIALEKPKSEVTYASATQSSSVTTPIKNSQHASSPQFQVQPQKNLAFESALQKYSHEQLKILLSQNKNPFLPLDPKDSINKYISNYVLPQKVQSPSISQPQSNIAYSPQISNNYLNQYQSQSYSQTPSQVQPQYPTNYYTPSVSHQNNIVPQNNYPSQVHQISYPQPSNGYVQQTGVPSHIPHSQSATANQGSVQYVYVPQSSPQIPSHTASPSNSINLSQSYKTSQTSPVQFVQQNIPSSNPQYLPTTTFNQAGQAAFNLPKTSDYSVYNPTSQPAQTTYYNNPLVNQHISAIPQSTLDGNKQYVSVPGNYNYHHNQAASNQVTQSSFKNVYGSTVTNQYPSTQYVPNSVSYKPENQATTQISSHNFAQYVPTTNQQTSPIAYKPAQTVIQSPNTAHYVPGLPTVNPAIGVTAQDVSKYNIIGSNPGHDLFAGLKASSGTLPPNSQFQQGHTPTYTNNLIQGTNTYPQIINSVPQGTSYKPVVENREPHTLQYQSPNTANNVDFSKFQAYSATLNNAHNNYNNVPNQHTFHLNQISNVQAYDNKNGQYAIDVRQGTKPSGASQVMVQTAYNLGTTNLQNPHSPAPVTAASDNSNIKYVYVPSYVPNTSETTNHGK